MLIGEIPMDLEIQASLWVFPVHFLTCIGSNCTSLPDAHVAQNVHNGLTSQELDSWTDSVRGSGGRTETAAVLVNKPLP